jgi:hypothetical protein
MSMLSNPAFGPRLAVAYVTIGALIDVWTAVWYLAFAQSGTSGAGLSNNAWFWVTGFFLTGLTLIALGLLIGPLGQFARKSELPPAEAKQPEAQIQATAAATPNPVVPEQAGVPVNTVNPAPVNRQQVQPGPAHQMQTHTM